MVSAVCASPPILCLEGRQRAAEPRQPRIELFVQRPHQRSLQRPLEDLRNRMVMRKLTYVDDVISRIMSSTGRWRQSITSGSAAACMTVKVLPQSAQGKTWVAHLP